MKRTIITLSAAVALAALVFTLGGLNMTRAQGQQGGQGNQGNQGNQGSVVGTWVVTVYVNTPGGPAPFATEFASFNPGGTFADAITLAFSSENPGFAGPLAPFAVNFSDAFGSWKQVGDDPSQIAGTFKRFSFAGANTPTEVYGSFFPGQNVGQATVQFTAALQSTSSGQILVGSFTFQLTNLEGTVVLSGSGPFTATRLKIEPLAAH
jgi:hypothetical protein